jgi:FKBP-type peptidyl-prolyl cis-trans isomerase 2
MEKGSVILVEFTGREKITGNVFDTTDEKTAKESGLYSEGAFYRPVTVIAGEGEIIKGLEDALPDMKVGEEKELTIAPENGFGERDPKLIVVLPLQQFRKNKMVPYPGLVIEADNRQGRVQSVSGGRVRVDFNNPLAGKTLEYRIKVLKEFVTDDEKAGALVGKYFPLKEKKVTHGLKEGKLLIKLPADFPKELEPLKDAAAKAIKDKVKGIKEVSFELEGKATAGEKESKGETGKKEGKEGEKAKEEKQKAEGKKKKAAEKVKGVTGEKKA